MKLSFRQIAAKYFQKSVLQAKDDAYPHLLTTFSTRGKRDVIVKHQKDNSHQVRTIPLAKAHDH